MTSLSERDATTSLGSRLTPSKHLTYFYLDNFKFVNKKSQPIITSYHSQFWGSRWLVHWNRALPLPSLAKWGRQPKVCFCSSFGFLCSWHYISYFKFFETNSSLRHIFGCKVLGLNDCQKNAIFLCS